MLPGGWTGVWLVVAAALFMAVVALLFGLLLGGALALIFAPSSGVETRNRLKQQWQTTSQKLKQRWVPRKG